MPSQFCVSSALEIKSGSLENTLNISANGWDKRALSARAYDRILNNNIKAKTPKNIPAIYQWT